MSNPMLDSAYQVLMQVWPFLVLTLVAIVGLGWVATVLFGTREAVQKNQPSLLYQQAAADAAASRKGAAALKEDKPAKGIERKLFDAGVDVPASTWLFGCVALAVAAAVIGLLIGGVVFAAAFFFVAYMAPKLYLMQKQKKRLLLLEEQLAQAELQIAESARSGLPVEKAILATVQASDEPLKGQFERVYNEITYGGSNLTDALANFARRTSNKDADLLSAVVAVQQESGSSLSAALEFLAETVRKRIEMRQTLRSKITEMKLSAIICAVIPLVMFVFCGATIKGFWDFYTTQPVGWALMGVYLVIELIGGVILYRMVDIKMD